uniref:Gastrin/cholecystokinin peptide hormone domain-containing protein n=1 Tax=Pelusios castaneus TaxID=367368 RepID=A0A8C8RJS3_9SAUR
MKGQICLCLLLASLAPTFLARPAADTQQLGSACSPSMLRRDLLGALSQEQKQLVAKFLPHIYAELANRDDFWPEDAAVEPLHDRNYPGWMDFGRRSLANSAEDS